MLKTQFQDKNLTLLLSMKKFFILLLTLFFFTENIKSQQLHYYLDNNLVIQNGNGHAYPFPFTGGLIAPQFSECDLNFDNVLDLVIFDRSGNRILTYINDNKAGISSYYYAPQYEDAFPEMHSWLLMADYNQDGKMDIFTEADAYYFSFGTVVYKNISSNGKLKFQKVYEPLLSYTFQYINGVIDSTYNEKNSMYTLNMDYPAIVDLDNDGDLDILTYGSFGTSISYYQNQQVEMGLPKDSMLFALVDECWGSFTEGGSSSTITLGENCDRPRFYKKSSAHQGSTLLLFDNDNDNDMDALIGDVSTENLIFLRNGKSDLSYPVDTMIEAKTVFPNHGKQAKVNLFPAAFYKDVNNDGAKDLLVSPNVASASNLNQILFYKNAGSNNKPNFEFQQDNFLQQFMLDLGSGCVPIFWDVDGDGKEDLIVANKGNNEITLGAKDRLTLFKNISPVSDSFVFRLTDTNFLNLTAFQISEMKPAFGDLNNDGKQDLMIGCNNGTLYYFENTSSNPNNPSFNLISNQYKTIDVGSNSAPQIVDLDNDGLNDLVIGNSRGFIQFFKNIGTPTNPDFSQFATIDTLGKVKVNSYFLDSLFDNIGDLIGFDTIYYPNSGNPTPHFVDLDNNGALDLVVGSDHGKLYTYTNIENNLNGSFTEIKDILYSPYFNDFRDTRFGGRIVPTSYFDIKSQKRNIMVGNYNGGLHFLKNTFGTTDTMMKVGIKNIPKNQSKVYPNPAKTEIKIEILNTQDAMTDIEIYDMQGRLCFKEKLNYTKFTHSISVADLSDGIYMLQIFTNSQKIFQNKFMVLKEN